MRLASCTRRCKNSWFLDDKGNDCHQGELGEITVKSPAKMRCYQKQAEATKETMQDVDLRTVICGVIDAGRLYPRSWTARKHIIPVVKHAFS